ncbi:hypothetical protein C6501_16465 [Candidatus Poribacteria bacterium]|nr:MAG: hypothetical protein C6501_16465 [Candidatus Poribacteria bacterium]
MKKNDVELIRRILNGDEPAFSMLVEKYQKRVHALAWRKIGDFHIAEEITQDTFLKAYQKLATLKKPQRFAGWLYVIATRCCQAWLRKKHIQTETLEEIDSDELEPEAYSRYVAEEKAKVAVEAQRQVVNKLLATLPESERTVITLHYFGEMTCEEMSEFLGVSANTIKSRLRRARNRLKKEEPMIREAISNFQISPNLTENIMQEVARLKPAAPSVSKPLVPWAIAASSAILIMLMLGIGSQYLARFQQPYSLDAQSERAIELVDAPVVQNIDAKPDVQSRLAERSDTSGKGNGSGEKANQVLGEEGSYTRWNLPEGAKRRFGKGEVTDTQLSSDGTRLAIAGPLGVWLYNVNTGDEIALLTGFQHKTERAMPRVMFSPDSKKIASSGYDNTIRIWNAKTGKNLLTISMPIGPARLFRFLTDGTWSIHTIPANEEVELDKFIPDGKTGSVEIMSDGSLRSIKFLHDSKTLMIQNVSGTIWLWDITTGKEIATYSPNLPEPQLEKYKNWLRMDRFPYPDKWNLEADAFVNLKNGLDVKFAFAVGDKSGTISIRDGQTDQEISTLTWQKASIENMDNTVSSPIQDRVRRPGKVRPIRNTLPTDWVKWISKLKISPDGKTLVSWSDYRMAHRQGDGLYWQQGPTELWDVATGERIGTLPLFESRRSDVDVKFSGDGKTLAITGEGGCAIWDVAARREIGLFSGEMDVKFSDNGKIFALIGNENLALWDIPTRSQIASIDTVPEWFRLEPKRTPSAWEVPVLSTISSDGAILAAINRQGTVNLWQPRTSSELKTLTTNFTKRFTALAFANNSNILASGDSVGNLQLWDLNTDTKHTILTSHIGKPIRGLAFSTDDTTLTSESDGIVEIWDTTTRKQVDSYTMPDAVGSGRIKMSTSTKLTAIDFSYGLTSLTANGGKLAAFCGYQNKIKDSRIKVWDITTGKHLCTILREAPSFEVILAFAHDGKTFATGHRDRAYLWNTNTGERLATFNMSKNQISPASGTTDVYAGAFTHDGKILAISGRSKKNIIFLWDIATQTCIATLKGHEYTICQLVFSPNDTILASRDAGGKILLWNLSNGTPLTTFNSPGGYISKLAFTPDGKTLASTNGGNSLRSPVGTIFVWDVPSK